MTTNQDQNMPDSTSMANLPPGAPTDREELRKFIHSSVEKERREKIKSRIMTLKAIVPTCSQVANIQKLLILEHTIQYIKYLEASRNDLFKKLYGPDAIPPPPSSPSASIGSRDSLYHSTPVSSGSAVVSHSSVRPYDGPSRMLTDSSPRLGFYNPLSRPHSPQITPPRSHSSHAMEHSHSRPMEHNMNPYTASSGMAYTPAENHPHNEPRPPAPYVLYKNPASHTYNYDGRSPSVIPPSDASRYEYQQQYQAHPQSYHPYYRSGPQGHEFQRRRTLSSDRMSSISLTSSPGRGTSHESPSLPSIRLGLGDEFPPVTRPPSRSSYQ